MEKKGYQYIKQDQSLDDQTILLESQDDMIVTIKDAIPDSIPIMEKESIVIGRMPQNGSMNLDMAIQDDKRQLSRRHLSITREANYAIIQVLGKSGMVLNENDLIKRGTVIKVNTPVSFKICDYLCQIEEADSTISPDQMNNYNNPNKYNNTNAYIKKEQNESKKKENNTPKKKSSNMEYTSINVNNEPLEKTDEFAPKINSPTQVNRYYQFLSFKNIIIAIILIFSLFIYWLMYSPDKKNEHIKGKSIIMQETQYLKEEDFYKTCLNKAKDFIKKQKWHQAKDYLLDIPESSEYFKEAQRIIKTLPQL